jgi:hypothetical protein
MERAASHSIEGVHVMAGTNEGLDPLYTAGDVANPANI